MKRILEEWNALYNLGSCSYEEAGNGLNYVKPSEPFVFDQLDTKAKERFKKHYKDLWKSWNTLKEVCENHNYSLYTLYKEFDDAITKVEDAWLEQMKKSGSIYQPDTIQDGITFKINTGYNTTPKYFYRQRLHVLVFDEASNAQKVGFQVEPQGQNQFMLKWNGSGLAVSSSQSELETLKMKIEEFLKQENVNKLVQNIHNAINKTPKIRKEALEAFEKQRNEKIKEINSKYRIIQSSVSSY